MRVVSYTVCWNEERMLPFYLRHYSRICDKMVFFDNQSTDRSREIILSYPNTEVRSFNSKSVIDERLYLSVKNEAYKEERGKADFVIVCDTDEFLWCGDLRAILEKMKRRKETILTTQGVEMVSETFPEDDGRQIWEIVKRGNTNNDFSKRICFAPEVDINYFFGAHRCYPAGRTRMSGACVWLLHYKWLGSEYVRTRYQMYKNRASEWNRQHGIAWKNLDDPNWVASSLKRMLESSDFRGVVQTGRIV